MAAQERSLAPSDTHRRPCPAPGVQRNTPENEADAPPKMYAGELKYDIAHCVGAFHRRSRRRARAESGSDINR